MASSSPTSLFFFFFSLLLLSLLSFLNVFSKLEDDPRNWARLRRLQSCLRLLHSGVLFENSDFGLELELGSMTVSPSIPIGSSQIQQPPPPNRYTNSSNLLAEHQRITPPLAHLSPVFFLGEASFTGSWSPIARRHSRVGLNGRRALWRKYSFRREAGPVLEMKAGGFSVEIERRSERVRVWFIWADSKWYWANLEDHLVRDEVRHYNYLSLSGDLGKMRVERSV